MFIVPLERTGTPSVFRRNPRRRQQKKDFAEPLVAISDYLNQLPAVFKRLTDLLKGP